MNTTPIKTRIFQENENLEEFILEHISALEENSLLVVTSKIVALSEGRTHHNDSEDAREQVMKEESEWMMRTAHTWLTLKQGALMSYAGIDESNANGKLILLPRDSYQAAREIRARLRSIYGIKNMGVLITDSRTIPFRYGIAGVALGYNGFAGIRSYVGTPDIFGRLLKCSRTNVADGLATAAVLCMGEGAEQQPLCVITDPPVEWTDEPADPKELTIPPEDDLYRPFFENLPQKN